MRARRWLPVQTQARGFPATTGPRRSQTNPGDAAMAWLLAAAVVLAVLAGLCSAAETALLHLARGGSRDRARPGLNGHSPQLQAVLAEPGQYLSVLLVTRV